MAVDESRAASKETCALARFQHWAKSCQTTRSASPATALSTTVVRLGPHRRPTAATDWWSGRHCRCWARSSAEAYWSGRAGKVARQACACVRNLDFVPWRFEPGDVGVEVTTFTARWARSASIPAAICRSGA